MTNEAASSRRGRNRDSERGSEMAEVSAVVGDVKVDLNTRQGLMLSIPLGMKFELIKRAQAQGNGAKESDVARQLIADALGYDLPATKSRTKKYQSDEEKKAAQEKRTNERNQAVIDLMNQLGVPIPERTERKSNK